MFFVLKFEPFWKESRCIGYFSMVYFACENTRDTKQPMMLPLCWLTKEC